MTVPAIARIPPAHEHHVEPFDSFLAVLLAKEPSHAETVNDLDGDIVTFWRVLRDRADDLCRAAEMTPHSRTELESAWSDADDELDCRLAVYGCGSRRVPALLKRTGWKFSRNVEAGHAAQRVVSFADRMRQSAERLIRQPGEPRRARRPRLRPSPPSALYVDPPHRIDQSHELPRRDAGRRRAPNVRRRAPTGVQPASVVLSG